MMGDETFGAHGWTAKARKSTPDDSTQPLFFASFEAI